VRIGNKGANAGVNFFFFFSASLRDILSNLGTSSLMLKFLVRSSIFSIGSWKTLETVNILLGKNPNKEFCCDTVVTVKTSGSLLKESLPLETFCFLVLALG